MPNANATAVQAIKTAAAKYGLDPQAMIAVARVESGLNPKAVGDGGHAFGLFQFNNAGGVITGQTNTERYLDPNFNAMEAARHIASIKGARGARGADAVKLIVNSFERPANKSGEISKALSYLGTGRGVTTPTINPTPSQTAPNGLSSQSNTGGQTNNRSALESLLNYTMGGSAPSQSGAGNNGSILNVLLQQGQDEMVPTPTVGNTSSSVASGTTTLPASGLDKTNNVTVQTALKALGTPYSWGGGGVKGASKGIGRGANTVGFDCSGLVQYAVKTATGVTIPRLASAQYAASEKVAPDKMQPGDIIAFGSPSNVHHIGIYMGNGKFIESPHTGSKVRISTLSSRKDVVGAGRFPSGVS